MRVLSWNLFHGRAVPSAHRALYGAFATALAGWQWDIALLQEVPPWWPPMLARDCDASAHSALTSRNSVLWLRRAIATAAPDVIKSNGGGCNAILVRGESVAEHRTVVLRQAPERRVAHAVRLAGGAWVANIHAQAHSEAHALADLQLAFESLQAWAGPKAPLVLGGDCNSRKPAAGDLQVLARRDVDAVLARGWVLAAPAEVLAHGRLSDHPPLLAALRQ